MLGSFANYFWQHPVAVIVGAVAVMILLIWMTGSGSRQRFITFKRTKETDQLARDLSRIAAALERIARSQETPTDYVGRPIPPDWEGTISAGEPAEAVAEQAPANGEIGVPVGAPASAERSGPPPAPTPARQNTTMALVNPLGGTAGLLGNKKKLDLPNPLYKPK